MPPANDLELRLRLRAQDRATPTLRGVSRGVRSVADEVRAAKRVLIGFLSFEAARRGISNLIGTNARLETLQLSLDTVTGSTVAGAAAFEQLNRFSARTPFTLEELTQAYTKLRVRGLDPSVRSLTSYGNTALAFGRSLDQLVEAAADAVTGEFERLKEFGIRARVSGEQVRFTFRGVTTTVRNNAQEIERYLLDLGETEFAGSIERQAASVAGAISNIVDTGTRLVREIGTGGLNAGARELLKSLSEAGAGATSLAQVLGSVLGGGLSTAAALVRGLTVASGALRDITLVLAAVTGARLAASLVAAARGYTVAAAALRAYLVVAGLAVRTFALLGGPAGLIIAAGAALAIYASRASAAAKASEQLHEVKARVAEIDAELVTASGKRAEALRKEREEQIALAKAAIDKARVDVEVARQTAEARILEVNRVRRQVGKPPAPLDAETDAVLRHRYRSLAELERLYKDVAGAAEDAAEAGAGGPGTGGGQELQQRIRDRTAALEYELQISSRSEQQQRVLQELRKAGSQALIGQNETYGDFLERLTDAEQKLATAVAAEYLLAEAHRETEREQRQLIETASRYPDAISRIAAQQARQTETAREAVLELKRQQEGLLSPLDRQITEIERWRTETSAALKGVTGLWEQYGLTVEQVAAERIGRATAAAARKAARESEEGARLVREAFEGSFRTAGQAIADFALQGKLDVGSLVRSILADLARLAVQRAVVAPLLSAVSGLLPGVFGAGAGAGAALIPGTTARVVPGAGLVGGFHGGGVAGQLGGVRRAVPPEIFANARRHHDGNAIIGSDEVPILARRGEGIFTPEQMRALGQPVVPEVDVTFVNQGTAQREVARETRFDGKRLLVSVVTDDVERHGPISRAFEGAYPVLQGAR